MIHEILTDTEALRDATMKLNDAKGTIRNLREALQMAYSHIIKHHNCSMRPELGQFCPVCHRKDGTEPELNWITNTLKMTE